jgi:4-hydroxybenzoate polyprenyltransferase
MSNEKVSWAEALSGIFGRENRFAFPILSTLVLVILLLFYKELCPWCQARLVPALVALCLWNALIAHLCGMAVIRKWPPQPCENILPAWLFWLFFVAWTVGYLLFLAYIFAVFPPTT